MVAEQDKKQQKFIQRNIWDIFRISASKKKLLEVSVAIYTSLYIHCKH